MTSRTPRSRGRRVGRVALVVLVLSAVAVLVGVTQRREQTLTSSPDPAAPSRDGYFSTLPAGRWQSLPDEATCARRVHRSAWEPRPSNSRPNHTEPDPRAVEASLTARPRGDGTTYTALFNTWLLPRVDGQHTGTTDENIQWAACKWGISDNVLRAMAAAESTWYQYLTDADGRCVEKRGCGDVVPTATAASRTYCSDVAGFGRDYTREYGPGVCPRTFSIIGVMSWQDPAWGRMEDNQNGTFPFNRDSTAFALDYAAANLRGCMEGWVRWLDHIADFRRDDLWGCVGVWYAGDWKSASARDYIGRVKSLLADRVWLRPDFPESVHQSSTGASAAALR